LFYPVQCLSVRLHRRTTWVLFLFFSSSLTKHVLTSSIDYISSYYFSIIYIFS